MKNLLVATILRNDSDTERIKIVCRKTGTGKYQWYEDITDDETGCPVAESLEQAKEFAIASWGAACWALKASWLK